MKKKQLLPLLLAVVLLIGCTEGKTPAANDTTTEAPATEVPVTATDAPAADAGETTTSGERTFRFQTTDLEGNAFGDSAFEGYDLIMINFWAYWCGPCVQEMPGLEQLHQKYPNMLLLGVIVDDSDMEATRAVIEQTGVTYPILYPTDDLLELAAGCQYIPTTYFLRADGTILKDPIVGSNDLDGWTRIVSENLP